VYQPAAGGQPAGLVVSHDRGETWTWVLERQRGSNITTLSGQAAFGLDSRSMVSFTVNRSNPLHAIFTTSYDAVQTLDGGETWQWLSGEEKGSMAKNVFTENRTLPLFTTTGRVSVCPVWKGIYGEMSGYYSP